MGTNLWRNNQFCKRRDSFQKTNLPNQIKILFYCFTFFSNIFHSHSSLLSLFLSLFSLNVFLSLFFSIFLSFFDVALYPSLCLRPVGLGCKIRRLRLCRGVKPHPMRPPTGRGWWSIRRKDGILVIEQSLIRWQTDQWLANKPLWTLLAVTGSRIGPIRSID